MTITVSAKALVNTQFNFTESVSGKITSDNVSLVSNCPFTYGSGDLQIDAAVNTTGVLASGGSVVLDMTAITKQYFDLESVVPFSGIKSICIANLATTSGSDIKIAATGSAGLTDLFNGGSGNLLVKPYGAFNYSDPYGGIRTSATNAELTLIDVGGSGASYSVAILGNLN
jgi:hypothetical protein